VVCKDVLKDTAEIVSFSSLNLAPIKLGYINIGLACVYVGRVPLRNDWRQGTRVNNLVDEFGNQPTYLNFAHLPATVFGVYPTFEDCMMLTTKDHMKQAWCRDWAVYRGKTLHHKGDKVGTISGGSPVLDSAYTYLKESLNESIS
jgi:hypothetical protein